MQHHPDKGGDPEQFKRLALLKEFAEQGVLGIYMTEYERAKLAH